MRTTKPISTISYNTAGYLELKLEEWRNARIISFWAYIWHAAEDDEQGLKDHFHVYIEPAKLLQTEDLKEMLKEPDPHNAKPLGVLSFEGSKFDHWYMYVLHDKRYLASKGQSRVYHYLHENITTSDDDELLHKARRIDHLSLTPYGDMLDAQAQGFTFGEYFARGGIPIPQLGAFERAWNLLASNTTERAGRAGHDFAPHEPQKAQYPDFELIDVNDDELADIPFPRL